MTIGMANTLFENRLQCTILTKIINEEYVHMYKLPTAVLLRTISKRRVSERSHAATDLTRHLNIIALCRGKA